MSGEQVHNWCKDRKEEIHKLVSSFEAHRPERGKPPNHAGRETQVFRIQGEIQASLQTLRGIKKSKTFMSQVTALVGNERTFDNAFYGPIPDIALGSPGGAGAAAGAAADISNAVLAVIKGARAQRDARKAFERDPSTVLHPMVTEYSSLVLLLTYFVDLAADHKEFADRFYKHGLNQPILSKAWNLVLGNKWLVLTQ